MRPIFGKRKEQGEFHNLLQEMRLCDPDSHFAYLRMSKERFDKLVKEVCYKKELMKGRISRKNVIGGSTTRTSSIR